MAEKEKISAIRRKLNILSIQFGKGYGVYSLVPDKRGQYGKWLKDNNLKVTESAGEKVFSLLNYFEKNKTPTRSKINEAEKTLSKWLTPLHKLDAMSEKQQLKAKNTLLGPK
jgi:hypothetical protein